LQANLNIPASKRTGEMLRAWISSDDFYLENPFNLRYN